MQRVTILTAVAVALAGMGITGYLSLQDRLSRLDTLRQELPGRTRQLQVEVERLRGELDVAREDADAGTQRATELAQRLEGLERELTEAREMVTELEAHQEERTSEQLDARLSAFEDLVRSEWDGVARSATAAVSLAESTNAQLATLGASLEGPSEEARWRAMVGPTVQLAGDATVGSGVLLQSRPAADGEGWETLVLTAWHVVRDIRADASDPDAPVPVAVYGLGGDVEHFVADLLAHDATLDAALLRLESDERVECGARLPTREELARVRVFRPVYAVGCPLGNDPIPTPGEVTDLHHRIDGNTYWMISAPTYIGNSGGGIFDGGSHALLGIFSKIYTHGALRPTIVPHMGLVTPIGRIYDWLDECGHGDLVPRARDAEHLQAAPR